MRSITAYLLLTMAIAIVAATDVNAAAKKPNIIIILADDLGFGDVACYNPQSKVQTPHLDRMASEGMRFTDAHSPASICTPTRLSLLTGRHFFRVKGGGRIFVGVGGPSLIEQGRLTLPQMLKNEGYTTAAVGKWHVGLTFFDKQGRAIDKETYPDMGGLERVQQIDYTRPIPDGPVNRGFDCFFGTACCPTTDTLYAYIVNDRIPNPPTKRKDQSTLPQHFYGLDCRAGMQADDFDFEEVDMKFLEKSEAFIRAHVAKNPDQPFFLYHAMQAVHLPSFPAKQFQGKTNAGPHGDFIYEVDHIVGALMKTLDEVGVADNTLVIFSSDNGPENPTAWHMRTQYGHDGAHPWRGLKRDTWEGGHRVPLIAHWPGSIRPGVTTSQTISLVDLMATIGSIVGAELPNDAAEDSYDFKRVLLGDGDGGGEPVRAYLMQGPGAIRHGRWKYVDRPYKVREEGNPQRVNTYDLPDTAPGHKAQLYDLEADPGETTNLYFKQPEMVEKLSAKLHEIRESGRSASERK